MLKISKKIKIFILVGIFVLCGLTIFILSKALENQVNALEFDSYKTYIDNEYVDVSVEMRETRNSSYHSSNLENRMESSFYDFTLNLQKSKSEEENRKFKVINYSASITAETKEGEFVYSEVEKKGYTEKRTTQTDYLSTSKNINFNKLLKKEIPNVNSSMDLVDQTPKNIYILIRFSVSINETPEQIIHQEIKYKHEIIESGNIRSSTTNKELSFNDGSWVLEEDESFISFSETTIRNEKKTNSVNGVMKDEVKLDFAVNQTALAENGIKNISCSLFGVAKNDIYDVSEKFDNNILLYDLSGSLPNNGSASETIEIDSFYEIKNVRLIISVQLDNGTTQTKDYTFNLDK